MSHQWKYDYHHKHNDGVVLVFDGGLGVYLVPDHPDYYFYNNRYYRFVDSVWHVSPGIKGPWVVVKKKNLPPRFLKIKVPKGKIPLVKTK